VPCGVYDSAAKAGGVRVGIDDDTAQFSVNAIRRGRDIMGRERYPNANRLMITADGGGSHGSRVRLFKVELQTLADETGMTLEVCHVPPGTSKWNKVEPRLLSHQPDLAGQALDQSSRRCRTDRGHDDTAGLKVCCQLDARSYPKGITITDQEMARLNITGDTFHPEWNYTLALRAQI